MAFLFLRHPPSTIHHPVLKLSGMTPQLIIRFSAFAHLLLHLLLQLKIFLAMKKWTHGTRRIANGWHYIRNEKRLKYMDVTIAMALRVVRKRRKELFSESQFTFSPFRFSFRIQLFSVPHHFSFRQHPPSTKRLRFLAFFEMATQVNQFYLFRWLGCFLRWILLCRLVGKNICRHKLHKVRPTS